jgi:hypothetical protein
MGFSAISGLCWRPSDGIAAIRQRFGMAMTAPPYIIIIGAWATNWFMCDRASVPAVSARVGNCSVWKMLSRASSFRRCSIDESVGDRVAVRLQLSQVECCSGRFGSIITGVNSCSRNVWTVKKVSGPSGLRFHAVVWPIQKTRRGLCIQNRCANSGTDRGDSGK